MNSASSAPGATTVSPPSRDDPALTRSLVRAAGPAIGGEHLATVQRVGLAAAGDGRDLLVVLVTSGQ